MFLICLVGWLVVLGLTTFEVFQSISDRLPERGRKKRFFFWLFWIKRPFETVFQSISGRLPERRRKKREGIDGKNVQTTPTRTYCKRNRPLPYDNPN